MAREGAPPLPVRLFARGTANLVSRAPVVWPILRGPVRAFWQRFASGWDERTGQESDERIAVLDEASGLVEPEPARILELGTGTGRGALILASRFPRAEIHAIDFSPAMIELARAKVGPDLADRLTFSVADASDLPFEDGSFDLVCQLNLPLFAKEIGRVVSTPGQVVIAHSHGPQTPYYTSDAVICRQLRRQGLSDFVSGSAGPGTYVLARRR